MTRAGHPGPEDVLTLSNLSLSPASWGRDRFAATALCLSFLLCKGRSSKRHDSFP